MCIFVGLIEGIVETTYYVTTVGIIVTDVNGLCMRSVGHGALSKISVEGGNETVNRSDIRGVYRLSVNRAEKSGAMWLEV